MIEYILIIILAILYSQDTYERNMGIQTAMCWSVVIASAIMVVLEI